MQTDLSKRKECRRHDAVRHSSCHRRLNHRPDLQNQQTRRNKLQAQSPRQPKPHRPAHTCLKRYSGDHHGYVLFTRRRYASRSIPASANTPTVTGTSSLQCRPSRACAARRRPVRILKARREVEAAVPVAVRRLEVLRLGRGPLRAAVGRRRSHVARAPRSPARRRTRCPCAARGEKRAEKLPPNFPPNAGPTQPKIAGAPLRIAIQISWWRNY